MRGWGGATIPVELRATSPKATTKDGAFMEYMKKGLLAGDTLQ
jgi:hypothetical protein